MTQQRKMTMEESTYYASGQNNRKEVRNNNNWQNPRAVEKEEETKSVVKIYLL